MPLDWALSGSSGVIHQPMMVGSLTLARPTESCPTMAYMPRALMVARSMAAIGSVPALLPTKMLTPSCDSSVACQEPCSQTASGKKDGAVGTPRDQPAYGLVHEGCGIAGTHDAPSPPLDDDVDPELLPELFPELLPEAPPDEED